MTIPDDGETIGLFEPLMVSEGSPARAALNDLALDLAEKSAAFRSSLPASIAEAYFSWLFIALVFLCASSPANADWKCTKGNEASTINSRKYIPGEIEFTLYDKRIYKDITEKFGKKVESSRSFIDCLDGNLCSFSSDFLSYIGVYKKYWPHDPEIMNICTSSSNCIDGYCSKNEAYERLVFDWKAGFVSFVKAKTKHGEAASVDGSSEINIEFTPDIVDVWAKQVKISRTEIISSMYMVLK